MVNVHYYRLESRRLPMSKISRLKEDISKHFLQRSTTQRLCSLEVALLGAGKEENSLDPSVYDSGEFKILAYEYRKHYAPFTDEAEKAKDRNRKLHLFFWLRPLVDIEMVVAGQPNDFIELQDYLSSRKKMEFVEAQPIKWLRANPYLNDSLQEILLKFIPENHPRINISSYGSKSGLWISGSAGEMLTLKHELAGFYSIDLILKSEMFDIGIR